VVVGARSAALLPFKDLRLVVIDEEQDESFKQEGQSPLYHARDVALARAKRSGATVVLGSATPSMETWDRAERGEYELIAMPQRIGSAPRAAVRVVPFPPNSGCLSEDLVSALKQRLAAREQSILLVNRRGFSTVIMCYKCGWVDRCPSCGVAKIQHQAPEGFILRCHHCDKKGPVPPVCPGCKNPQLRVSGVGTQKVVAEVKQRLPGARVLRMDRDTLDAPNAAEERIYERFRDHEADVLVGTKLVAKSFHFPEVTLVGVVDADTMIHMPDFRASERTAQLLAQVAGRSGRASKEGQVIIQTRNPGHDGIQAAADKDFGHFASKELTFRRELKYPPYAGLVRLIWQARVEENAKTAAEQSCEAIKDKLGLLGDVLGPTPTIPPRARGFFMFHALMKVFDPAQIDRACADARAVPLPSTAKLKINVDPYDLL
jgi:primosomal protein N' (replication factor Y) (superfamily II helicase)